MFESKPLLSSPNLHLPAVKKPNRRAYQPSPDPSIRSMASPTVSENVSALKAKYTDYALWLKASSKQNREPVFTHELLKHSLCQMGLDTPQAEQLVSTCSWYVYQFHKELGGETELPHQPTPTETKKSQQSSSPEQHKKTRTSRSKKRVTPRDHSSESNRTVTSTTKESSISSGSSSPIRNKFSVLPAIPTSDPSLSPRSRRVDFENEQPAEKHKSSHWRSATVKTRILPKLRSTDTELSTTNDDDSTHEIALHDLDLNSSHPRRTRTRSILRKQTSSCSSEVSEVSHRKYRSRMLTPVSTIVDEVPLGTQSQRLFGGSKCFAEIMNELEEQKLS